METQDWAECVGRMRLLWPQATIAPEVAGEWWPTAQRWNRADCWQAVEDLAVELAFPPSLAELAKRVALKRFERGRAERDLVAEVVAEYGLIRKLDERWTADEALAQALYRCYVPEAEAEHVERRARMAITDLGGYRPVDELLAERWRHVGSLLQTQADVRQAFRDAQAAELDAETTLDLMEAAAS